MHVEHFAEGKSKHEKQRQKMKTLRQNFEKQVKTLLNDKQKTEFEQFVKRHKPQSGQKKPQRR